MTKKRKGFGRPFKNSGERKHDESRKKEAPPVTSNWGTKKPKTEETAERSPGKHKPSYDVQEIKIADIKIGENRRALNPEKLNDLMQSIRVSALQTPITVRSVEQDAGWGKTKTEWHLVSGLHRWEAMKQLGETVIPCFVMEGDERVARMWEISENLHRAELTPLEYDEQVVEWIELLKADPGFSGQNVQKKGRGRPKGGISEAARNLPVKGDTHAAKRKTVGRAVKVNDILPEAKEAIKKAGLDKNRTKYLKVAAEKTLEAQLAKVQELTAPKPKTTNKRTFGLSQKAKADPETLLSPADAESLEYLIEELNEAPELKLALTKASPNVRERFFAEIRKLS
jgi:ParB-like chromosome segregation protein Spo0J